MKDPLQRAAKKAKKSESFEDWPDEVVEDAAAAAAEEADQQLDEPSIEDLEPGAVVLYWDDWRGVVRDAFVAIGEFWVADEASGQIVTDEHGDIVNFKASELKLVGRPPIAPPNPKQSGPPGGVIIVGDERQMRKMLTHFGTPDALERHQPQLLLAFPLPDCEADRILPMSSEGVTEDVVKLAQELRPDVHVAVRAYHLKHAVQELGPDVLRMDGMFLMASVTLPYGWEDIEDVKGWMKKWRREVCTQIDMGPTARGFAVPGDATPEDTARRALGQELGVVVSLMLWDEQVQMNLRQSLDVELPLNFTDVNGGRITVLLLPSDALVHIEDGVLCFTEAPDADYLAEAALRAIAEEEAADGGASENEGESALAAAAGPQGKSIAQWEKEQAQFAHLPTIAPDWVRVISQKTGDIYFFNKKTQATTFDLPSPPEPARPAEPALPAGWTREVSKSTGKTYYFNKERKESRFDPPTAEPSLPAGWTKQVSKSTGKTYYFHAVRRESRFDRPTA